MKTKPEIVVQTIFDHCYFYSAYVDDTNFFWKNTISIKNMVDTFHFFWTSQIKSKLIKMLDYRNYCSDRHSSSSLWYALWWSKRWCINNIRYSLFLLQKKKKKRKKFYTAVTSIQRQLEIRKIINLILEGKKVIFKKLTMSKFVFQSLITTALKHIVNELEKKTDLFFVDKFFS